MNRTRINRLLKLIGLLQAGKGYNASALAEECGVTRRTIFRDVDALRQAGVPLAYDEERQHYHVPGTYFLPPTNFTVEEALAVLVLCHELGEGGRLPFYEPAHRAATKLENSLPSRLREQLRMVSGSVRIKLTSTPNRLLGQHTNYAQLVDAIARRRSVRIRYSSVAQRKTIVTKLNPYQLLFSRHSWYVIGRSSLHRAKRTFKLGRIVNLEPLEDQYRVPRGFNVDRYLGNAWHLIPEPGPDHKVMIHFSPTVARNVSEVTWHKTQQTTFKKDGSLNFRATVSGLSEISWWVLGYGDEAEALKPPKLRQMVGERAKRMAKKYAR